jgi:hypothetical protein
MHGRSNFPNDLSRRIHDVFSFPRHRASPNTRARVTEKTQYYRAQLRSSFSKARFQHVVKAVNTTSLLRPFGWTKPQLFRCSIPCLVVVDDVSGLLKLRGFGIAPASAGRSCSAPRPLLHFEVLVFPHKTGQQIVEPLSRVSYVVAVAFSFGLRTDQAHLSLGRSKDAGVVA